MTRGWENLVRIHLHSLRGEGKDSTHASLPLPLAQHLMLLPWRVYLAAAVAAAVDWPCDVSDGACDEPLHHAHMKMTCAWQSPEELPHSPTGLTVVELE